MLSTLIFLSLGTILEPDSQDMLITQIAADNRLQVAACEAFATRATLLRGREVQSPPGLDAVDPNQHKAALMLLWSYPGISSSEITVYHELIETKEGTDNSERMMTMVGNSCSITAYADLATGLLNGLGKAESPFGFHVRSVVLNKALRDVMEPVHLVGLATHMRVLQNAERAGLLRQRAAKDILNRLHKGYEKTVERFRAEIADTAQSKAVVEANDPIRKELLAFLLREIA